MFFLSLPRGPGIWGVCVRVAVRLCGLGLRRPPPRRPEAPPLPSLGSPCPLPSPSATPPHDATSSPLDLSLSLPPSLQICVPDWPFYNKHPVKWLDQIPPSKEATKAD